MNNSNDFKLLKLIDEFLKKKLVNINIIYRPHPYGITNENYKKFDQFKKNNKFF